DTADGTRVEDPDWRPAGDGYEVRINGQWMAVPPEAGLTATNRVGYAIVWRWTDEDGVTYVRCFLPGPGAWFFKPATRGEEEHGQRHRLSAQRRICQRLSHLHHGGRDGGVGARGLCGRRHHADRRHPERRDGVRARHLAGVRASGLTSRAARAREDDMADMAE